MTRKNRTPAERAQEAFDTANRISTRLLDQAKRANAEADRLTQEAEAAVRRRDYLAQHPDLPKQKQSTTTSTGDTA